MANTIRLKQGSGSDPSASDLVLGELAIRTDNGKIFLKKDNGSVAEVSGGGGIDDGDKGDITVSNSGATFTIDNDVVSTAKMANMPTDRILGREASGTGDPQYLTATEARSILNVENGATADQTASEIKSLLSDQDITTTGNFGAASVNITDNSPSLIFTDSAADSDYRIRVQSGVLKFRDDTNSVDRLTIASGGTVSTSANLDVGNTLYVAGVQNLGNGSGNSLLSIKKADNNVSDHIRFFNGTTRVGEIGCHDDTWLRINNETSKNIFTPRYIRADGGFFVDGTSKGINGSGNFIGGTIAGASDYGTLLRSNTADTASGDITFSGGAGAVTVAAASDIRIAGGTWTGEYTNGIKIQADASNAYIQYHGVLYFRDEDSTNNFQLNQSGNATFVGSVTANGGFSGSGASLTNVNATTLDSIDSGSFLRSDAADTMSEVLTLSKDTTDVLNLNATSTNNNRGISFNGRTALSAHHNDGWLRLNNAQEFGNGVYTPLLMRADGGFETDGNTVINGSGNYVRALSGASDYSSLLRSNANDTATGIITFTSSSQYPININGSHNGKIVLQGSASPYITFRESSTDKAYLQWNSSGYFDIQNNETGETLRVQSGSNGLKFGVDGTFYNVWHELNDGPSSGLNADLLDGEHSSSFLRSNTGDSASGDITFDGGAGAATIGGNSDIRFSSGNWTGEATKIQHHANWLYLQGGSNGFVFRHSDGTDRWRLDSSGALRPSIDGAVDLGTTSYRVGEGHFLDLASRHLKADNGIVQTKKAIAFSYSITADYNALAVDPTINNGVTITVPSGSTFAIV